MEATVTQISNKELREIQLKSLEIAKYFVNFCNEHNLLCYFCGGGCIGALRHKGFIPWDDDLDFFMPRDDYQKMIDLWNKDAYTEKYSLEISTKDKKTNNLFATICDNDTTLIKPLQANLDMNQGLSIDILPLDGYPETKVKRMMQVFWALTYSLFCAQVVPVNHGKLITFIGNTILHIFKSESTRYKIWSHAEKKMMYPINKSNFITELCSGPHYMMKKYPKDSFMEAQLIEFEDCKMPIPKGYHQYLNIAFGNYMEMPPKIKQVPHHEALYVNLKEGYKKFRGIYYFKK